ncbi:DUF4439 domain-containing protein [Aeromicrobium wangtongii]|uniref:DUF4439 domain-containing protein n=1 Tax=Aeromicrobium wangtongii TaxID=2969247 RepID=UPI002017068E|nr:DUF4439 domain-containing protein [Aeromicrobium wangtongii]MCL3818872.1 ferritin-like domain-containing protein [Aeromicrobium wangtongii]
MTPVEALQAWLALEHEAVWFYPVVGARRADLVDRASASFEQSRDVRDALESRLRALGAEPVDAELTYDVGPVTTSEQASAAAQSLEARIAAACVLLAGVADDGLRRYAVRGVTRAALAEQTWGAAPQAFPGLP